MRCVQKHNMIWIFTEKLNRTNRNFIKYTRSQWSHWSPFINVFSTYTWYQNHIHTLWMLHNIHESNRFGRWLKLDVRRVPWWNVWTEHSIIHNWLSVGQRQCSYLYLGLMNSFSGFICAASRCRRYIYRQSAKGESRCSVPLFQIEC